jgi:titin
MAVLVPAGTTGTRISPIKYALSESKASTTTVEGTQLSSPTDVLGSPGNKKVSLTWAAPSSLGELTVDTYIIEYATVDSLAWMTQNSGTSANTQDVIVHLLNDTSYKFRVIAIDQNGQRSLASQQIFVTPRSPGETSGNAETTTTAVTIIPTTLVQTTTIPAVPTTVLVTTTITVPIKVTVPTGSILMIPATTSTTIQQAATVTSVVVTIAPVVQTLPPTILNVAPNRPLKIIGTPGDGSVYLTWRMPIYFGNFPITNYIIQYSSDGGMFWAGRNFNRGTGTSVTILGLKNNVAYKFRIIAVNAGGQSSPSETTGAITPRKVLRIYSRT